MTIVVYEPFPPGEGPKDWPTEYVSLKDFQIVQALLKSSKCPNETCRDGTVFVNRAGVLDTDQCEWCAEREHAITGLPASYYLSGWDSTWPLASRFPQMFRVRRYWLRGV